jgi:hypothetical protein
MYDIWQHTSVKRTTIFLPEPLERRLQSYARRRDQPMAEVIRQAIASHLDAEPRTPIQLPPTFDSGRSDIATRFEELLFKDFDVHAGARPPRAPRKK